MSYLSSVALCPYYQYDKNNILHCELGTIYFFDKQMRKDIGYEFCGQNYNKCPFKIALDSYHERKGSK